MADQGQGRRVALITRAAGMHGPKLAEVLARGGHNLVLEGAAPGQAGALRELGAEVETIDDAALLAPGDAFPGACERLLQRILDRFGRLDAAALTPPPAGAVGFTQGSLLEAKLSDLQSMCGYFDSTFHWLRAVVPVMKRQGGGQIVVFTSAAGKRPEANWSLYGGVRAGQSFFVQAVALEHAKDGISINAVGSKNVVAPDFPLAPPGAITDDHIEHGAWSEPRVAETPLGRLGHASELAAFAAVLLDGRSRFQTGQFFAYSGGWDVD
jgi:NAD(P)-dependent dehydrogenase (short-subunit alcohol dehydrogenase family)